MKQTINVHEFQNAFMSWDTYKDNFSRAGLRALFESLKEYEESTGEELELDVVALCCDYVEYESAWDAMKEYQPEDMPVCEDTGVDANGHGMDLVEISEAQEKMALEWLQERTQVIEFDGGVIIAQF